MGPDSWRGGTITELWKLQPDWGIIPALSPPPLLFPLPYI